MKEADTIISCKITPCSFPRSGLVLCAFYNQQTRTHQSWRTDFKRVTAPTSCPLNWQIPCGCCLAGVDLFQLFKHSLRLLNSRQCRVCLMTAALITDHLLYTDHKATACSLTHCQIAIFTHYFTNCKTPLNKFKINLWL